MLWKVLVVSVGFPLYTELPNVVGGLYLHKRHWADSCHVFQLLNLNKLQWPHQCALRLLTGHHWEARIQVEFYLIARGLRPNVWGQACDFPCWYEQNLDMPVSDLVLLKGCSRSLNFGCTLWSKSLCLHLWVRIQLCFPPVLPSPKWRNRNWTSRGNLPPQCMMPCWEPDLRSWRGVGCEVWILRTWWFLLPGMCSLLTVL